MVRSKATAARNYDGDDGANPETLHAGRDQAGCAHADDATR
jgi:hypothetical protein